MNVDRAKDCGLLRPVGGYSPGLDEMRLSAGHSLVGLSNHKAIPAGRCAVVRHLSSRESVSAATYLKTDWLPSSGETLRKFPIFFHYVNVGPQVREQGMVTDVYLPIL